ncbi:MAG: glycoside hydrolase [Candidatus Pacebacteria bacterium]|nr:glycoside hydrolase [Candidatus Paceibacterota bacterium]
MTNNERWGTPLCSHSVTVHSWENRNLISDAPALIKLANGTLLCSVQLWSYDAFREDHDVLVDRLYGKNRCMIFASTDDGTTWTERGRIPFTTGKLLQHDSGLLFIGSGIDWKGLYVARSTDSGRTWSDPVRLRDGKVYATATGWVVQDETLYWAADDMSPSVENRAVFAFSCDLRKNPLDPGSWCFSNDERHPGLPQCLGRGNHNGGKWLEPNVVNVDGTLLVIVRVRASQESVDGVVPGIGAICDLTATDERLQLNFSHYYPIPGAQNQFHIIRDEAAGLFWMTSNQVTGKADDLYRGWGKERRFLMLHYSLDAQNWFPTGVLLMWPKERQAYNYCSLLIDGEDLLVVSRTAENAKNQHDNDKITFHRFPDFRSTAVNLVPDK